MKKNNLRKTETQKRNKLKISEKLRKQTTNQYYYYYYYYYCYAYTACESKPESTKIIGSQVNIDNNR